MSYILPANSNPSKILYIDSRDATSYLASLKKRDHDTGQIIDETLTSYFQYQLNEKIEIPLNQRALISLNSATIPYSFYNIRHNINDTLVIKATNLTTNAVSQATLIIESGNYTAYTLAKVVETFIAGNIVNVNHQFTFNISFDLDKQKFIYTISTKLEPDGSAPAVDRPSIKLEFLFTDATTEELTPHIELGFPANTDFSITLPASTAGNIATPVILYSTNVIDVNGSIHGVYVRTNLVSNGTLDSQSGTFSSILARIPINVNSGGILFATPNNATHRSIVDLRYIDTITIRLTDERNRLLDLNGLHFQVAVAVDFVYGERKHTLPMGHLTQNSGYSYHRNNKELPLDDRSSKINNNDNNKN